MAEFSSYEGFSPKEILSKLSLDSKISLLAGVDFWHTAAIPDHGIPSIRLSDGSSGIRGTQWFEGIRGAAIPCGTALAATWNRQLLRRAGVLLGEECRSKGVRCWLGPTINVQRSPLGGRGYESYSEDPYLSGVLASEIIAGCESTGVIATPKHLVCNDQENDKRALNAIMTERALREIYLRPFQIIARDAPAGALMTSYNKVNGIHVSEDKRILEDIVRQEWKWDPLIMSDWYGTYSTTAALAAGLDLEMPGETKVRGSLAKLAVSSKLVKESIVNKRALKVLEFIDKASRVSVSSIESERDSPEDRELNLQLARESIVLLKNERSILPIPRNVGKIAIIGSHMKDSSMNSTGATTLEPYYTIHPYDAIIDKLSPDTEILYEVGAQTHKMLPLLDRRLLSDLQLFLFNEPPSEASRSAVGTIPMRRTFFQLLDYYNPYLNAEYFYGSMEANFVPDEDGPWEFGLTVHGIAKLFLNGELLIDQTTDQQPGDSFFRRGSTEKKCSHNVNAGETYRIRVEFGSASMSPLLKRSDGSVTFGGGGARLGACPLRSPEEAIRRAVEAARQSDYAVVCTGLSGEWETEGHDRTNMDLPPNVDDLISQVSNACPNTIVVNRSGMPVTMPWASDVPAIIQAWYGGNETGSSIADVLFGDFNPCGKLPISWPKQLRDNPSYLNFGSTKGRVLFGEDVFVGYRWYDAMAIEPLWSFGHGMSYTSFTMSEARLHSRFNSSTSFECSVALSVQNTGGVAGTEVLQLYVSALDSSVSRPVRELHGFQKVTLEPGEEKEVRLDVDKYAMSFWDESEDAWCRERGLYKVTVVGTACSNPTLVVEDLINVQETLRWLGV